jgi:CubicO group peptidase (beta-lactamase class C family)
MPILSLASSTRRFRPATDATRRPGRHGVRAAALGTTAVATDTPVTGDSLFRIASLSKSFTALAVMQLVDAGLLGLDDPVREPVPEFKMADPRAGQVTVGELLDHPSGITDALVPDAPTSDAPSKATRTEPRACHESLTGQQLVLRHPVPTRPSHPDPHPVPVLLEEGDPP